MRSLLQYPFTWCWYIHAFEHIHLDMSSFSFWDRVLLYRCILSWTYEFFLPLSLWHWYYSHVKQHLNFFLQLNTAHVVPREKVDLNYVSHHILNDQLLVILLIFTNFVVDKHTWTRKTQMYTPPHTHTPNTQIFLSIHSFMCTFLQGPLLVKMLITSPAEVPITPFISKKVIQQDRYVQVNTSLISQSLTFTVFCWWDIKRSSNNICHFHVSWPLLTRNLRSGAPYVKLSLFMWQSEVSGSSGRSIFLDSWKTSFKHTQKHIPAILQAIMVGSL